MNGGVVIGTGIDLVETDRMDVMLKRWGRKFKDKVFLKREQKYCDAKAAPNTHYAGRFAVKEAVTKAFGTGITHQISWLDMEVVRNAETGAPSVVLSRKAQKFAESMGADRVLISLSHTKNYAVAQALLVGPPAYAGKKPGAE